MKEALFYKKEEDEKITCFLCRHNCRGIKHGGLGACGVRWNSDGRLYSLNYGQLAAAGVDPIEKKPLYHFFPGSAAYSIACRGCNFKCGFCQNWQISQVRAQKAEAAARAAPQEVVAQARKHNCVSISYTYTEPTIYFEFAYDCAKLAKEKGLYNNFVTNGYMSEEALACIAPFLDAANVDLKSFREDFYRQVCGASLKPVLENIVLMKKLGIWVEVTTLVIPGNNDGGQELEDIASFIVSLDKSIPWHISCFYPQYKFSGVGVTRPDVLERAYKIGKDQGLEFVYLGNVRTDYGENTYCPDCKKLVIERRGFFVKQKNIKDGKCGFCGAAIAGIGL